MLEEPVSLRQFWRWTNAIERILVEDIDRRTTLTQRFPGTSVVMRVLGVLVLLASGSYLSAGQESLERIQAVTDYISGMTDRYAITRYRDLFEPRSWAGT